MTLSKCCDAEVKFGMVDDNVGHGMHEERECSNCGGLYPETYDDEESDLFDVAVFDSLDDSTAEVLHGSLPWKEALEKANSLWESNKHFGVEIIDLDENNMEPIVWIRSKA